jgi:hypothetical protein
LSKGSRNSEPERITLPLSRFAIPPSLSCGKFEVCDGKLDGVGR